MSKILEFSDLLITKFCHDLAGAIGAVNNGIEFLEDADNQDIKEKALELISKNGKDASDKLKFFRFIYGLSASKGETDISNLKDLAKDFFDEKNVKVTWHSDNSTSGYTPLTHKASKLLLNMTYAVSCTLISGGTIDIYISKNANNKEIKVIGKSDKIKLIDDLEHILKNHELRDIKLNNVQIHLTSKIASELGIILGYQYDEKSITLTAQISST